MKLSMKVNKKGFTLIELLGVIVILAIVMGVAIVSVSYIVDSGKSGVYSNYEDTLETAAENYLIEETLDMNNDVNKVLFPKIGETVNIKYSNIKSNDSSFKSLTDPNGGNCDNSYVLVTRNQDKGINYNLTYKVCLICDNYKSAGC